MVREDLGRIERRRFDLDDAFGPADRAVLVGAGGPCNVDREQLLSVIADVQADARTAAPQVAVLGVEVDDAEDLELGAGLAQPAGQRAGREPLELLPRLYVEAQGPLCSGGAQNGSPKLR